MSIAISVGPYYKIDGDGIQIFRAEWRTRPSLILKVAKPRDFKVITAALTKIVDSNITAGDRNRVRFDQALISCRLLIDN